MIPVVVAQPPTFECGHLRYNKYSLKTLRHGNPSDLP
jgi:hypothetical protein